MNDRSLAIKRLQDMGIWCDSETVAAAYWKGKLLYFVMVQRDYFARILGTSDCYANLQGLIGNMIDNAAKTNTMKEIISDFVIRNTSHDLLDLL